MILTTKNCSGFNPWLCTWAQSRGPAAVLAEQCDVSQEATEPWDPPRWPAIPSPVEARRHGTFLPPAVPVMCWIGQYIFGLFSLKIASQYLHVHEPIHTARRVNGINILEVQCTSVGQVKHYTNFSLFSLKFASHYLYIHETIDTLRRLNGIKSVIVQYVSISQVKHWVNCSRKSTRKKTEENGC